ncbi:hypothetical protein FB45DRAFT_1056438 [Roridomyces roridus]|uniref:Mid2 domain-containing protein n=1 Tax=Roridomyces roridus TaxID=1738132 RepID=A0AAD7BYG2_9AGAR|nr:hypothetical protein FB45DRAFT_1056438 [Roridomyces roridus]
MVGSQRSLFLLACTMAGSAGVLGFTIEAPSTVPFEGSMWIIWLTDDGDPPLFNILIQSPVGPPVSSNEFIVANNVNSTDGTFTVTSLPSGVTPAEWELAFIVTFGNDEFATVLDSTDFEVVSLSSSGRISSSTSQLSSSSPIISSSPSVPAPVSLLASSTPPSSSSSSSSSSTGTSSTAQSTASLAFSQQPSASVSTTTTKLSAIVGGALGGLALLLLIGGLFGWWYVRRRRQRQQQHQEVDPDVEDGTSSFFPEPVTRATPFTSGMPVSHMDQSNNSSVEAFPDSRMSTILDTQERSSSPAESTTAMSAARASSRVLTSSFSPPPRPPPIPNSNRSRQTVLEEQVRRLQSELRALRLGNRRGRNTNRTGTSESSITTSDATEMG